MSHNFNTLELTGVWAAVFNLWRVLIDLNFFAFIGRALAYTLKHERILFLKDPKKFPETYLMRAVVWVAAFYIISSFFSIASGVYTIGDIIFNVAMSVASCYAHLWLNARQDNLISAQGLAAMRKKN